MLRRLFTHRLGRALLWIFITFVTLLVLLHVWTNWSGRRRWAAVQAMLQRDGETLDFQKLLPATPPETENLLAIEALRDIAEVTGNDESQGLAGARRKALSALNLAPGDTKPPESEGMSLGKSTAFQKWVRHLQESKFLDLPASPAPAPQEVLAALDAKFPVLKQLADDSPRRPQAMFIPGLRERERPPMLFAMRVPHYAGAQSLARALALRARAAVAARDSGEAARSIVVALRVGQACRQEPLLIGFLVSKSVDLMALESVWQGLHDHAFTPEDLGRLQAVLAAEDTAPAFLAAMRGELVAGIDAVVHLQAAAAGKRSSGPDLAEFLSSNPNWDMPVQRLLPGGLFDHWKSAMVETELLHVIRPLQQDLMSAKHAGDEAAAEVQRTSNVLLHPDRLMVNLVVPAITPLTTHALLAEARRRQAVTAIALERFFLKNARFPRQLEELRPGFLPEGVPADPCDGQPLRYSLASPDAPCLWSVGVDEKTDAGRVSTDEKGAAKLNQRDYQGDWTWQYEPVQ